MEGPPAPDLVIAELKGGACIGQQFAEAFLPLRQRPHADGFAIEVEEIEQEKDEGVAFTGVRCVLDQAERGCAVGADAAQLPVEIGLFGGERCNRRSDACVFIRPVKPGPGQQPDRAAVQPG